MTSRQRNRQEGPRARPPPGLRKKFTREELRALALIHISLVDTLIAGATLPQLWEWMGTVLSWSKVAQACRIGEDEIDVVVDLAARLGKRFEDDGFVVLDAAEAEIAHTGSIVMDLLAATVDVEVAASVGSWATETLGAMRKPPHDR